MTDNTPVRLELPGDKPFLTVEVRIDGDDRSQCSRAHFNWYRCQILPRGLTIHRLIVQANGRVRLQKIKIIGIDCPQAV